MINRALNTSNTSKPTDPSLDSSTGPHLLKQSMIDHAEILQPGAILSMIVHDPREVSFEATDSPLTIVPNQENKFVERGDLVLNVDEAPCEEGHILSSARLHPGRHDLLISDCGELWDSGCKINPPVTEEIHCMEKHNRRIKFFCLDSGNDQEQAAQVKDCSSRSCPIILLKHAKERLVSLG
jgi:ribonuclease P/MRP protein subunit POP1